MNRFVASLLILGLVPGASASDLGNHRNEIKTDDHVQPDRDGGDGREGGETIATAFPITHFPFVDVGSTCDNLDDYDEVCPYTGSFSPDVVYALTPLAAGMINIDLCGSLYDTKLYVYENAYTPGAPYACNDDYYFDSMCGMYVSRIDNVSIYPGNTYYIVIDGYGGDCGTYHLEFATCVPGGPSCTGVPEGEPPLVNQYVDTYNGGCNSEPPVFQFLWGDEQGCLGFCGRSGWYLYDGYDYRDTDWFHVTASGTSIDWTLGSWENVNMYVLEPGCPNPTILYSASAGPCFPGSLSFPTTPGASYWLWVGPQSYSGPAQPFEFEYGMDLCGIESDGTGTTATSWGGIKKLYR